MKWSKPAQNAARATATACFGLSRLICCFLIPAAFTLALLLNCKAPATGYQAEAQPQEKELLLLYQKTPCYGTCPAYDAFIYSDGTVLFKAWSNVPFTDTLQAQLTNKELARLKRDIRHLSYHNWKDTYLSQRTDQASTIFTFYEAGIEVKSTRHQEGGPAELLRFQKKMDALMLGVMSRQVEKQR